MNGTDPEKVTESDISDEIVPPDVNAITATMTRAHNNRVKLDIFSSDSFLAFKRDLLAKLELTRAVATVVPTEVPIDGFTIAAGINIVGDKLKDATATTAAAVPASKPTTTPTDVSTLSTTTLSSKASAYIIQEHDQSQDICQTQDSIQQQRVKEEDEIKLLVKWQSKYTSGVEGKPFLQGPQSGKPPLYIAWLEYKYISRPLKNLPKTVQLAGAKNVELYPAEKIGHLGKNSYRRCLIGASVYSTAVTLTSINLEAKQEQTALFLTEKIPKWTALHEQHLTANGLNGHYVGDEIILAGFRSAALASLISASPQGLVLITPETTPGLLKVKATVDQDPKIQQQRASKLFKRLRPSHTFPSNPVPGCVNVNDCKGNGVSPSEAA
ncbi:hypothetical protein BGX24_002141 [Mortierella sp. AD032]|nr:hypothetical protein BGX24_002141 [Mortierella sp. AD032]